MYSKQYDEPWNPKLVDILYKARHGSTEEQDYYSKFGLSAAEWDSTLTDLIQHRDNIVKLFEERFAFRMINRETLEQWQIRLQTVLDEEGPRADRAFRLYRLNKADIDSETGETERTTFDNLKDELGGTDRGKTSNVNTPDAVVNASDQYADSLSKSESTYGRTSTRTGSVLREKYAEGALQSVNTSIGVYRNLESDFVDRFEKLFMNIFW